MCGFLLCPEGLLEGPIHPNKILAALRHRGADGNEGWDTQGGWFLGHTRLAVATEGYEGDQPFRWTEDPRDLYAFVGEIFDDPLSGDPSEVDVHQEFLSIIGTMSNVESFRGFHTFDGFWSAVKVSVGGTATVVVDHLGIKPVYYWGEHNIFCSEMEPMFSLVPRPPLDETYLSNCIKFGYDHSGRTPYQGITQMAPGTARVTPDPYHKNLFGHTYSETYWHWPRVQPIPDVKALREEVDASIARRVVCSKHPVGLLLSGGLDSSIIYYSLKRQDLLQDVEVFSIDNGEFDSLPADDNISRLPAPSNPDLVEVLDYMGAPMDLGSAIPQVQLAKVLGSRGIRACLTGDGADELFGGYRRAMSYDSQSSDVFCELPYYHLPRLDRVMMREGLEVRSPFLAPRIVKFALGLPWEQRTHKQVLREAYFDLPSSVLSQAKVPLKSVQVREGGVEYRSTLVDAFRHTHQVKEGLKL